MSVTFADRHARYEAELSVAPEHTLATLLSGGALLLIIASAVPAFMLRATGVMDDSVFWVVGKSLLEGKVLYRDIFFTQPPVFVTIPETLWLLTSNVFLHRVFLFLVWVCNGALFYYCLDRLGRATRLVATALVLISAFILQSYALHTEIFVLTLFLISALAMVKGGRRAALIVGLTASASFFVKPVAPLVFIPVLYPIFQAGGAKFVLLGSLVPVVVVAADLLAQGTVLQFAQQVLLDNSNVGLSLTADWVSYSSLAIAPMLVPVLAGILLIDRRPTQLEWWLTVAVFVVLLVMELLRGARHYGLLNLCVLAWMAIQAQAHIDTRKRSHLVGMAFLLLCGLIFQAATIREILNRGSITDELSASTEVATLPRGSLQVFGNNPPRLYMLLNSLVPAYPFLFVYDTNRDLVIWDNYMAMIQQSPPDYIAVDDRFQAVEYGQRRSTTLTDATAVRTWIEQQGTYQRLEAGRALGIALYRRD